MEHAGTFKVGLTGGIGSGKSRVADFLAQWGATVIDSDVLAHELTAPGGAAIEPIRKRFGSGAIADDGSMDRQAMRVLAFADPGARKKLEAILHPMIRKLTEERAKQARGAYLVFVVPLLVESGRWRDRFDRVCVVDCEPETQIARVRTRSGLTTEVIERIMSVQASRQERLAVADDVINNDAQTDVTLLEARTRAMHEAWLLMAGQRSAKAAHRISCSP